MKRIGAAARQDLYPLRSAFILRRTCWDDSEFADRIQRNILARAAYRLVCYQRRELTFVLARAGRYVEPAASGTQRRTPSRLVARTFGRADQIVGISSRGRSRIASGHYVGNFRGLRVDLYASLAITLTVRRDSVSASCVSTILSIDGHLHSLITALNCRPARSRHRSRLERGNGVGTSCPKGSVCDRVTTSR